MKNGKVVFFYRGPNLSNSSILAGNTGNTRRYNSKLVVVRTTASYDLSKSSKKQQQHK